MGQPNSNEGIPETDTNEADVGQKIELENDTVNDNETDTNHEEREDIKTTGFDDVTDDDHNENEHQQDENAENEEKKREDKGEEKENENDDNKEEAENDGKDEEVEKEEKE